MLTSRIRPPKGRGRSQVLKINLQLFAEGGEGAAAAADQGAAQTTDTGVKGFDVDAAIKDYQDNFGS